MQDQPLPEHSEGALGSADFDEIPAETLTKGVLTHTVEDTLKVLVPTLNVVDIELATARIDFAALKKFVAADSAMATLLLSAAAV